jgi:2,5-diketo-D-gluconate reductase B
MLERLVQGEKVPALGFGTWQLQGEAAREATRHALEIGYRQIDTAQAYGNEEEVGRAIKESGVPREEIFLTTKIVRDSLKGENVGPATDTSLRKLGTDHVDLLLIHWPTDAVPLEETLDAMVQQQEAGKVRHLGVSNFKAPLLRQAMAHTRIFADQVPYQPGRTQNSLRTVAEEQDVLITAYSPLRGEGMKAPALAEVAAAHGKTVQQVALRWLLQQDKVSPIPRSADPDHRQQNFEVFDFELSDDEMARIDAIRIEPKSDGA